MERVLWLKRQIDHSLKKATVLAAFSLSILKMVHYGFTSFSVLLILFSTDLMFMI